MVRSDVVVVVVVVVVAVVVAAAAVFLVVVAVVAVVAVIRLGLGGLVFAVAAWPLCWPFARPSQSSCDFLLVGIVELSWLRRSTAWSVVYLQLSLFSASGLQINRHVLWHQFRRQQRQQKLHLCC
jgi:hypothetical protein